MAVRFDGSGGDNLTRTTDLLDIRLASSISFWFRPTAVSGTSGTIFNFSWGSWPSTVGLQFQSGTITYHPLSSSASFSTSYSAGQWIHIGLVRASATGGIIGYFNGVQDMTNGVWTDVATPLTAMHWGEWANNDTPGNFRLANLKLYSNVLTAAEILADMHSYRPVRFDILYEWHPHFPGATERLADYSGNGRTLTQTGTLTDEDGPPLSWSAQTWVLPYVAAAGGAAIAPLAMHYARLRA